MAEYSMRVQIADIVIRFESELESDISDLDGFFKYHHADSDKETDCTVILKRQASFYMPKDAEMLWQSKRHGSVESDACPSRRRISVLTNFDTFGLASCYVSRKRGEYYYGLMQDKSWICCRPSEHRINYVLHHHPLRKSTTGENEVASPLSAIPLLIHVISTIYGRFLVHGAAVGFGNRAFLFLGKSGSGKSTLSTDLARQKASFMGDDIVLIYMKDGAPMIGSLLFQAKLHVDNAEEKSNVDVPEEMQADYCLSAPLAAAYLVRQSGLPTSSVEPRPSIELLQQLMEASNGMMMQYDKQQWLATMYGISERIPYFIFNFGSRSTLDTSILKIH